MYTTSGGGREISLFYFFGAGTIWDPPPKRPQYVTHHCSLLVDDEVSGLFRFVPHSWNSSDTVFFCFLGLHRRVCFSLDVTHQRNILQTKQQA